MNKGMAVLIILLPIAAAFMALYGLYKEDKEAFVASAVFAIGWLILML